MNQKLSAVIITKNEADNIERCLKSIEWVDEIIVVDTHSNDETVAICEKYGCIIKQVEWMGFGKTKQFAVDQAANDWVFSIDADEEVSRELREKILKLMNNPSAVGYYIKRDSFYLGQKIKYCGWDKDYPLRLFNKNYGGFTEDIVHESVKVSGSKQKINEPLLHYTYPTIASHMNKMNRYSDLGAEVLIEQGKSYSIFTSILLGLNKFLKMYVLKLGILDGKAGFLLCINSAYGVYLKYVKTWNPKK